MIRQRRFFLPGSGLQASSKARLASLYSHCRPGNCGCRKYFGHAGKQGLGLPPVALGHLLLAAIPKQLREVFRKCGLLPGTQPGYGFDPLKQCKRLTGVTGQPGSEGGIQQLIGRGIRAMHPLIDSPRPGPLAQRSVSGGE